MYIELTEQQKNNLILFLNRVNMTGAEVPAYVDLLGAISNPVNEKQVKEGGK